jgi:hypothetical protein
VGLSLKYQSPIRGYTDQGQDSNPTRF